MKRVSIVMLAALVAIALAPLGASAENGTAMSADSITLSYTVQGAGEPAIVFVHCWCCDKSYWNDQIPYFEKKYKVFAGDVVAVVDALKLEKVILVGHSMGGPVSLEAARMLNGRVVGVIGVDTFQDFGETVPEDQQNQWLAAFEQDFPGVTDRFVRSMFAAGADSALVNRIAADMSSAPPEVGIGAMKSMLCYDPALAVKEIKAPIRSINADKFPTNVEGTKKIAPSFAVKFMPGRGHFVQLEDPATFNKLLDETITEIVKGK
jgi:pimeloyl-ACP methyl ester carboxylesterase